MSPVMRRQCANFTSKCLVIHVKLFKNPVSILRESVLSRIAIRIMHIPIQFL